jgi:hypothetical protein
LNHLVTCGWSHANKDFENFLSDRDHVRTNLKVEKNVIERILIEFFPDPPKKIMFFTVFLRQNLKYEKPNKSLKQFPLQNFFSTDQSFDSVFVIVHFAQKQFNWNIKLNLFLNFFTQIQKPALRFLLFAEEAFKKLCKFCKFSIKNFCFD